MSAETQGAAIQKDALTPEKLAETAKYLIDSFKEALLDTPGFTKLTARKYLFIKANELPVKAGCPMSFRIGEHTYQVYYYMVENTLSVYRQKTLDSGQILEAEGMRISCNIDGTPSDDTGIYWNSSSIEKNKPQNAFESNTQTAVNKIHSMLAGLQS